MRQILKFEINQPQTVALEFPDGVNVKGTYGPQVKFSLTDNGAMYVTPELAQSIRTLGVLPGEPFVITKCWLKGRGVWWDLEKVKRAGAGAILASDLPDSPFQPPRIEPANPQPAKRPIPGGDPCSPQPLAKNSSTTSGNAGSSTNGSGESVPGSQNPPNQAIPERRQPQTATNHLQELHPRASGMQLTRTPPVKPSYEEAFRECLRIVTAGLAQTGEQWSDGAKQAMVSTLMIQLGRENRLGEFRPQQIGKVA